MGISVHRAQGRAGRPALPWWAGLHSARIRERGHMFAVDLLLGILVFGYIIVRQLRSRPVRSFNPRLPLILGVIGVVELVSFVKTDHDKAALVATLAGSLVLAAVMGG